MNTHLLILILSVVVASFSQILLKKSAQKTYRSIICEYLNPYVICGYGMMFLSIGTNLMNRFPSLHLKVSAYMG